MWLLDLVPQRELSNAAKNILGLGLQARVVPEAPACSRGE